MNFIKFCTLIVLCTTLFACQNNGQKQSQTGQSNLVEIKNEDPRPLEQQRFLNRVKVDADYSITSDAIKKDDHIVAFNKYAIDSLKSIKNWEMIVTEITDNSYNSSSFAKAFLDVDNHPVYNLLLVAPIKIDRSIDTIAIDNKVEFTYTILKSPKGDNLKQQLVILKNLTKGDTVIVSGSITHLDESLKVNFASFYENFANWNVDLLLTDIRKKSAN